MKTRFYKAGELNESYYVKVPLRSSAILNMANITKYCFFWSILAYLQPCGNSHPSIVKNYKQYFDELNIKGFDYTNTEDQLITLIKIMLLRIRVILYHLYFTILVL